MPREFIHKTLGVSFWVEDDRVDEYKAMGHTLVKEEKASEPEKPTVKSASKESKKTTKRG